MQLRAGRERRMRLSAVRVRAAAWSDRRALRSPRAPLPWATAGCHWRSLWTASAECHRRAARVPRRIAAGRDPLSGRHARVSDLPRDRVRGARGLRLPREARANECLGLARLLAASCHDLRVACRGRKKSRRRVPGGDSRRLAPRRLAGSHQSHASCSRCAANVSMVARRSRHCIAGNTIWSSLVAHDRRPRPASYSRSGDQGTWWSLSRTT